MSDPIIRPLAVEDLDEALRLSTVVGWNQRLDDWRMLLRLSPAGAFAAFLDARGVSDASIVGTAIGIDYGGFAWIAMMIVDPAYRGRGLGRRLLEAAMGAVPSHLPIRLDATPLGRPLYQRYGFEDEATLGRHVIDARLKPRAPSEPRAPLEPRAQSLMRPLTDADLGDVIEQDRETFGGTRGSLLDWAFHGAPQYAYVARNDNGLIDYCLGREGRVFDQIGPVVARDDDIAHALVSAALAAADDRRVAIDAFDSRCAFAEALRRDGFVVQRPLIRMCRRAGATRGTDTAACVGDALQGVPSRAKELAILGPEFA